ncbi:MAG: hypothetical protein HYZ51_01940 [Candidatus Doudnabacteria bacterium]|nr:hypothetical protein [Candidatus Doudnabacteria bacterium]
MNEQGPEQKNQEDLFKELEAVVKAAVESSTGRQLACWNRARELQVRYPNIYSKCRLYHLLVGSGIMPETIEIFDFPEGECEKFIRDELEKK